MTCLSPISSDENTDLNTSPTNEPQRAASATQRQPLSPKQLAPLVIPTNYGTIPRLTRQLSLTRLRSGSTPVEPTIRSARTDDSPRLRTPYTPLSASTALTTPKSANTALSASTLPTPVSAPIMESRSSPKPWEGRTFAVTPKESIGEKATTPKTEETPRNGVVLGHRRGVSESGSIMERGRPRKRTDVQNNNGPLLRRSDSKRSKSAERRAFEQLPKGYKVAEAPNAINQAELASLQKQAFGQAARFEVLKKEDVDALSRVSSSYASFTA
jgi:hypothetical protein